MSLRASHPLRWVLGILALSAALWGTHALVSRFLQERRSAEIQAQTRRLRAMYFAEDFEGGAVEGATLVRRFPEAPELKAWYLVALACHAQKEEAVRLARVMRDSRPKEPWGWFALAGALGRPGFDPEALAASEQALALMPGHPDFVYLRAQTLLLSQIPEQVEAIPAFVDRHRAALQDSAEALCVKAQALEYLGSMIRPNQSQIKAAYDTLDEARRIDPGNLHARYLAGMYLSRLGEPEKGFPLLEAAARLAPGSVRAHREYWRAYNSLDTPLQQAHRKEIEGDLADMLARKADQPWALAQVADQYGALGMTEKQRSIEDRILKNYPESLAERLVLRSRLLRIRKVLSIHGPGEGSSRPDGTPVETAVSEIESLDASMAQRRSGDYQQFLWDYVERRHADDDSLRSEIYVTLFESLKDDPDCDAEKLRKVVQGLADYPYVPTGAYQADGAVALADRALATQATESMLRGTISKVEQRLAGEEGEWQNPDSYRLYRDEAMARLHDALGWVLFRRGRSEQAEVELQKSYALNPGQLENLYHLGRLAWAGSDVRKAEEYFSECSGLPSSGKNPCRPALEELVRKSQGAPEGSAQRAAQALERGRALRRDRLLATRLPAPKPIPTFHLNGLDGTVTSSEDLKGKVAVIDFWGTWCPSCVRAMPEFQKLADKYREDPEVAILTVNAWDSRPKLDTWLSRNPHDLRILLDDGYVTDTRVESFPTTWFLDRTGRLAYILVGNEGNLVEEDSWLIEDLKRR